MAAYIIKAAVYINKYIRLKYVECDHVITRSRARAPHHVYKEGFY